jgi:hypothetical protein
LVCIDVDWDETILAPKERDFMSVVGGIIGELIEHVACMREEDLLADKARALQRHTVGYTWSKALDSSGGVR